MGRIVRPRSAQLRHIVRRRGPLARHGAPHESRGPIARSCAPRDRKIHSDREASSDAKDASTFRTQGTGASRMPLGTEHTKRPPPRDAAARRVSLRELAPGSPGLVTDDPTLLRYVWTVVERWPTFLAVLGAALAG